ncbi:kininogen-2-like isoform X2 [Dendropsophus ebraccatus]|uniref:kininogen-2-like isoform X2 n=1 Tax=Dendropsophus ebraccatus TaxID=150705 RepID=UPI0038310041
MKILPILLLCLHCLLGSATIVNDDCNDQNVFSAVDEALRSFNNGKEDGNIFILYQITDAKIKNEDGQIHHYVEYETHEGSCEVKSGKSWQECSSAYAHKAKCSAHVLFNKDLNLRKVESQNCSSPEVIVWPTVTTVHHQCLGCPQPIDIENKELLCFVHSTIEQVNNDADHPFYYDLESIVSASRQVVFGWNYDIKFLIRQTNCSKFIFKSKNDDNCKSDNEGKSIACTAQVHVNPDGKFDHEFLECISETGVCINCPVVLDTEDPEIRTLLVQVMDEYNFNSNNSELYNVVYINTATKKAHLTCKTKINVTDKTVNVHSAPYCEKENQTFLGRIGGLSPLRLTRSIHHIRNDMLNLLEPIKSTGRLRQSRHIHNNNNDNDKGHKYEKNKKKSKKEKHKYKHQTSSSEEDNNDEVPQNPPTDIIPRCPGRVWQPKGLSLSIPTVKTLDINDLALALDGLTPSTDQDLKKNEPITPMQAAGFNDEDLLG